MIRAKFLLLCALLFFMFSLVSCRESNSEEPLKPEVVSIDKSSNLNDVDAYVMVFSDGSSHEFIISDENAVKTAYDLYIEHCPNYQRGYELWIDDLINGRPFSHLKKWEEYQAIRTKVKAEVDEEIKAFEE